jgi:membrane-associated phospholipid phosphatase
VEGHVHAAQVVPPVDRSEHRPVAESGVPFLEPGPNGPAERFYALLGDRHPVTAFLTAVILGYALLAAASITAGLLVTEVLLESRGIERLDERLPKWLAAHRTETWTDFSWVGTEIAGGYVVPAMVALAAVVAVVTRRWRVGAFVVFAVAVESGAYRATTLVVERPRPHVERLEGLDPTASYPSGHTAAAIALYCGLALLLTSRFVRGSSGRIPIWVVALAIPPLVGLARMYRGMHHPLDVLAGVPIGIAAIVVVVFACRVAGAAVARREDPAATR